MYNRVNEVLAWEGALRCSQCCKLVVEEVCRQEQVVKYGLQAKEGKWLKWDMVEKRAFSWKYMDVQQISFIILADFDVHPQAISTSGTLSMSCLSC